MRSPRDQAGAVLIVALLMLTVLAVLGVNSVTDSTMSLRVVSNMQSQQDVEAVAQDAIEQVLSSKGPFVVDQIHPASVLDADGFGLEVDPRVSGISRVCRDAQPVQGYSAVFGLAPEETVWEVVATVVDAATGARVEIHQGVAITMTKDSCPSEVSPTAPAADAVPATGGDS